MSNWRKPAGWSIDGARSRPTSELTDAEVERCFLWSHRFADVALWDRALKHSKTARGALQRSAELHAITNTAYAFVLAPGDAYDDYDPRRAATRKDGEE